MGFSLLSQSIVKMKPDILLDRLLCCRILLSSGSNSKAFLIEKIGTLRASFGENLNHLALWIRLLWVSGTHKCKPQSSEEGQIVLVKVLIFKGIDLFLFTDVRVMHKIKDDLLLMLINDGHFIHILCCLRNDAFFVHESKNYKGISTGQ